MQSILLKVFMVPTSMGTEVQPCRPHASYVTSDRFPHLSKQLLPLL